MEKKKYLIASGCSFTEGHILGKSASWTTYMPYETIDLSKGGRGNRLITQVPISFGMMNPDIAKDSLFIIQLSECLRTLMYYDSELKKYGELTTQGEYYHVTPGIFLGKGGLITDGSPTKLEPDSAWKAIYEGRNHFVNFYTNITFTLLKTYWGIINFVNFCENNNYPYLIFDGLNSHIPYEYNGKWVLPNADTRDTSEELGINVVDTTDGNDDRAVVPKELIRYIKSIKNYYQDTTLWKFIMFRDNEDYFKGNGGHPNELGAKKWAEHLEEVLENL
tara:strand:+ start:119 stop:949 length:831 start_codon:yes stop_codon:yes gene_type:complete